MYLHFQEESGRQMLVDITACDVRVWSHGPNLVTVRIKSGGDCDVWVAVGNVVQFGRALGTAKISGAGVAVVLPEA